jgi:Tfp pilus assembly protein PilN
VRATELTALVAHHVSRFFRKNGTPLVTDALWVRANGTRVARAAAVEETLVENIAAGARAAGLALDTITVADAGAFFILLPGAERATRAQGARRRVRILAVMAAGAWALVGALFIGRLTWERRVIERELIRLEAPLAAVLAARREVRAVEAALEAIARADRDRARALGLLTAITAALPDSSILTSFAWRDDGYTILSGAARQAAAVASRLDRVPELAAPHFDGAVVREKVAGREWERFTITIPGDGGRVRRDGL